MEDYKDCTAAEAEAEELHGRYKKVFLLVKVTYTRLYPTHQSCLNVEGL
jgi:hypothetical protein